MSDDYFKHFPKEIKCVILQGYGNTKQLRSINIPLPKPGDNEVLINVKSCGINFLDLQTQQGILNDLPKIPFVPGFECSGKIVHLGKNVNGFDIGDRVICLPKFFAFSEYIVVNVHNIYKIPDYVSYDDAAALAFSYLTAFILLFEIGSLKQGQSVLFHSAGGGVGCALLQLCRTIDNVSVFATSSKGKHDILRAIYDNLFDENDYFNEIKKFKPEGIDLVLDCLCGEHTNFGLSLTKPLGKYVLYGTSKNLDGISKNYLSLVKNWWQLDKISPLKLYEENRSLCGFNLFNLLHNEPVNSRLYLINIFTKLFELYQDGKIKPVIDSIFSFENVSLAYTQLYERKNIGKVLIDPYYEIKEARKKNQLNKKSTDDYDDENSSDTDGPDEINDSNNSNNLPDELL